MKKTFTKTTINVVAIVTAITAGTCLIGSFSNKGPDREMRKQLLMNRQLDYAIGRIRACGELKRYGVYVNPQSPDASLCADVIIDTPVE